MLRLHKTPAKKLLTAAFLHFLLHHMMSLCVVRLQFSIGFCTIERKKRFTFLNCLIFITRCSVVRWERVHSFWVVAHIFLWGFPFFFKKKRKVPMGSFIFLSKRNLQLKGQTKHFLKEGEKKINKFYIYFFLFWIFKITFLFGSLFICCCCCCCSVRVKYFPLFHAFKW